MNASFARGIRFDQALAWVQRIGGERVLPSEAVALRSALGRVLAQDVVAPMDLPPFDNSAMDGFALRGADLTPGGESRLRLIAERFAGHAGALHVAAGECARITTGALLPEGADTVVLKENARAEGERVYVRPGTASGANVRRAGEDCRRGSRVMTAGTTLAAPHLGLIAALGIGEVQAARRPAVAVFTTGDELRCPGEPLREGQIYDSNRVLLQSLLAEARIDTLGWPALPDDAARIVAALDDAATAYDLILTCGGVSAGERDLLPGLVEQHGRIHFWKVMMRPGMPVLFGEWRGTLLLALPGNPVSVLATFRRLALPLLDAMLGRCDRPGSLHARLQEPVSKNHDRLEFRRARLSCTAGGELVVRPHPAAGSHQQRGAAESNALLLLPDSVRELASGAMVEVDAYGAILHA